MEKFFLGKDLIRAKRMARLFNKLTGRTIYIEEDFGSERPDDPWGFFVRTLPPMHRGNLYCIFGEEPKGVF